MPDSKKLRYSTAMPSSTVPPGAKVGMEASRLNEPEKGGGGIAWNIGARHLTQTFG